MGKTILHRVFGAGRIPRQHAPRFRDEGIILIDEGIGGSITLKKFRGRGRRHWWKRIHFTGCILLTEQTLAGFAFSRPIVHVPLADERLSALQCTVEKRNRLLVSYDASAFNEDWSGTVDCRFKTAKAEMFSEHLSRIVT